MNRKIPGRNYLILILLFIITIGGAISFYIVYNNASNEELKIPVLRDKVAEIKTGGVDVFLSENPDALIYVGVANDDNSRKLEKDLIELINKKQIELVYINITDLTESERKDFYKDFNDKYSQGEKKLSNYPAFIIVRNQKVYDMVQRNSRDLYLGDIEQLLDIYEIGEKNA